MYRCSESNAPRTSALLLLSGWAALGCAPAVPQPARAAHVSAPLAAVSASIPTVSACANAPVPHATDVCSEAVCIAGQWRLAAVGPRVECELSPNMAERQALTLEPFKADAGVCFERECVPRWLCSQRCASKVGDELATPLYTKLRECRQRPNYLDDAACAQEVLVDRGATHRLGERVLDCFVDCGFTAPRLNTQLIPNPNGQQ